MLNIFGKLYTLLRRPQPNDPMTASGEWEHVDVPKDGNTSGTNIDVDMTGKDSQQQPPTQSVSPNVEELTQKMESLKTETGSYNKASESFMGPDGDHKLEAQKTHTEKGEDEPQEKKVSAETQEKKETAESQTETAHESKKNKKDGAKKKRQCKYYRTGQKCFKGKLCPFEHARKGENHNTHDSEPASSSTTESYIREADYPRYSDFVVEMTEKNHLVTPKDLIHKLGYQKDMTTELMAQTVIGQYQVAMRRKYWYWVNDARYFAELFFSMDWINENIPTQGKAGKQRKTKQKNTKKEQRYNDVAREPVRDFRIKDNPNIQVYTGNAAGDGQLKAEAPTTAGQVDGKKLDGFVTDYTDQVLQNAMKQALHDGLSESLIMEVIDDVTKDTDTPRKRGKVNKVDLSRTPQKRPDQLAFGFNFHADKLVKDSPVTETGEVLVPGVPPTTPKRKAREQLALGFNYHSDVLAKTPIKPDSPADHDFEVIDNKMETNKNRKVDSVKKTESKVNGHLEVVDNQQHLESGNQNETPTKSGKCKVKDIFAVGFSYNSDQLMKQSLDKVNGNVSTDEDLLTSCIEEMSRNENESGMKVSEEELPLDNRPAGSVW